MGAPVNVIVQTPSPLPQDWTAQVQQWEQLNREARGNPDFYPLTIKAAYVIGVIHDLCVSVTCLFKSGAPRHTFYLPAYGIFASGVELLGRCITSKDKPTINLKTGLMWIANPTSYDQLDEKDTFIQTSTRAYTFNILANLRHFAAHGQGRAQTGVVDIDYEILSQLHPYLRDGLESYWGVLTQDDQQSRGQPLCNKLAHANIAAFRNWPVLKSWRLFTGGGPGQEQSITAIFNQFNWQV